MPSIEEIQAALAAYDKQKDTERAAIQSALDAAKSDDAADDALIALRTQQLSKLHDEFEAYKVAHPATPSEPEPEPKPPVTPPATGKVPKAIGQSMESVPANVPNGVIQAIPAYFQPGDFTGSSQILWTSSGDNTMKVVNQAIAKGCKIFWFSFKDGKDAAAAAKIEKFLASIPKDKGYTIMCTYFHEHNGDIRDGNLTLANFKAGCKNVAAAAHKHGFLFGPNHNGNNKNSAGKWGFWPEVWAAMEGDVNDYDFWSFDGYCPKYQDPNVLYKPAADYAKKIGKPLCHREFSSPNGAEQAAWATKVRKWCDDNVQVATWWSSQVSGTGTINYRMTEASAKNYYKL